MGTDRVGGGDGFFQRLADVVVRWPWLVILVWIALAVIPLVSFPPLAEVAARQEMQALPKDAPVMVAAKKMADTFKETGSDNILLVILTDDKGLSAADEASYRKLVDTLRQDTAHVVSLQDFITIPQLRDALQSKDGKAWNLPVTLVGAMGSPEGVAAYGQVAGTVKKALEGSTLTPYFYGSAATVGDLSAVGQHDQHMIEYGTAILVLLILILVYRNLITMLLPVITIVFSVGTANGVLAALAQLGLPVSPQTLVLMTAVLIGAGVDYAVFLISRYHDYVREGMDSNEAVNRAMQSIGKVIAASAATVGVTFLAMIFAKLPLFTTVGPAMTISVAIGFIGSVTLLPAIMVLIGPRGWIKPRRGLTNTMWRRSGIRIVRRPRAHLVGSLVLLIALASCATLVHYNYDDRKTLPKDVPSAFGYQALEQHFPTQTMMPQFLLVESPKDLRSPRSLADMEEMAGRISQIADIESVQGITRPTGQPLEQAKATYQAGEVGGKLNEASGTIDKHDTDLNTLTNGAHTMATSLGQVRGQVTQVIATVSVLVDALQSVQKQLGGGVQLKDIKNAAQLVRGMQAFGDAVGLNAANIDASFDWTGPVLHSLETDPMCSLDAPCNAARIELRKFVAVQNDGTFQRLSEMGRRLQNTEGTQTLDSSVSSLEQVLNETESAAQAAGINEPGGIKGRLAQLQQGADALAQGSKQLADGVQLLVDQTRQMGAGLSEASAFLLAMKNDASAPSMAGFYIPPQLLTADEFKKAAVAFVSHDGHAVRYLVLSKLDPFSTAAMDQTVKIENTARDSQPNTTLSDAKISMAGVSAALRDTRDYYHDDFQFFVIATIIIVLLIMIVLLRAIVAPLYLIGTVLLSYFAALGLGVLVFQLGLGQEIHWSVPGLTFVLLVAVGADYNLLLISRIREESPHGVRGGVIRTVTSTGGVITSAGLIFAASMLGLMFASINTMMQAGFIIGVGILLDTFLVRTVTVPAIAAILGRANWWPHSWAPLLRWLRKDAKAAAVPHRVAEPGPTTLGGTAAAAQGWQSATATAVLDHPGDYVAETDQWALPFEDEETDPNQWALPFDEFDPEDEGHR